MKKRGSKKTGLVVILIILVLLISIGYAAISTNLAIGGNATITAKNWLIYFTNIQPTIGSVTATTAPTTNGTTTTTLTWAVTLDTPGQFYEYTVDVKNDGSIDAMIGTLSNSTLTTDQAKYLDYTVTYSDGAEIEQYDKLEAGHTETLRVRVEFKADPEELPSTASAITLNYASNYVQSDTTHAKARNTSTVTPSGPTVQNLAQAGDIHIGDTVNYSPASGSITLTSAQTGYTEYGTTNPLSQTISTAENDSMTWKVFSVDQTTGTVKIIAQTDENLTLQGKTGFANGIQALNSVSAIFGTGYGAKTGTARSITMEDIATAIGFDYTSPSNPYLIYVNPTAYGTQRTYTKGNLFTRNGNSYNTTTTTATTENPITITSDGAFNICNAVYNTCSNESLEDLLTDNFGYWCATQYCNPGPIRPVYSIYFMDSMSMDDSFLYLYDMDDNVEMEGALGQPVMPIIELDPAVQMEKVNDAWNFITD